MFWGLKLEPGKRYSTTVDKSFHISMATLDASSVNSEKEVVSVALEEGGTVFLLTNLRSKDALSSQLDLNFLTGDRITLFCKGQGIVHLSGYMVLDEDDELSATMLDDEAEDEEEDDEEVEDEGDDESFMGKAKKALQNAKGKDSGSNLKRKMEVEATNKAKMKKIELPSGDDEDESEESGDGDINYLKGLMAEEDSDEEEDDDDEDEDEEDEEEEEEEEQVKQPSKKQKKQQQQQNQQKNKTPNKEQQQQQQQGKKQKQQQPQTPKTPNGVASPGQKQQQQQQQAGKKDEKKKSLPASPVKEQKQQNQKETVLTGGVKVKDVRPGNGPVCKDGKMAVVYYTGRLKSNGKVFDSVMQGSGFKFKVGQREVIQGWDIGVAGMKVGGKRIITCPPHVAYGVKGCPPQIPPNSTLVFEVELKGLN